MVEKTVEKLEGEDYNIVQCNYGNLIDLYIIVNKTIDYKFQFNETEMHINSDVYEFSREAYSVFAFNYIGNYFKVELQKIDEAVTDGD